MSGLPRLEPRSNENALKDIEVKAGKNEIPLSTGAEQRISRPLRAGGS